ncbi:MAG TPA: hypothetical protein VIL26_04885 [Clostridia bacterium]
MKNYVVKQRLFNLWRSSFYIKDDQDVDCFLVKSDANILFRLTIYDMDNQPLIKIKKRYFRILPRFDVCTPDGKLLFKVKRKIAVFSKKMKIKSKNPEFNGLKVKGNIFAWEFDINRGQDILARVSKKVLKIADTYCVTIADEANAVNYLALAIVIDCVYQKAR